MNSGFKVKNRHLTPLDGGWRPGLLHYNARLLVLEVAVLLLQFNGKQGGASHG